MPNADFFIEVYVDPREPLRDEGCRDEGPFGDHNGHHTLPEPYPVFHVTAITHREDAVSPAIIVGASVKLFLPIFKMNFPQITGQRRLNQGDPKMYVIHTTRAESV